jgi:hypothetical protein
VAEELAKRNIGAAVRRATVFRRRRKEHGIGVIPNVRIVNAETIGRFNHQVNFQRESCLCRGNSLQLAEKTRK